MSSKSNISNGLKVSVVCTVYNHEAFLRKCLDGFVMQKTDFPFEVIVHDDCSTDGSAEIIREYAQAYPEIIKPVFETENQYSKHDGSLMRAVDAHVRGEYVAICEGDDYWIDPLKLSSQVELLDTHPEVSLCFHNVDVVDGDNRVVDTGLYRNLQERFYTPDEIIYNWTVPTCSALIRKDAYLSRPYDKRFVVGDNVMWLAACAAGKAWCINRKMAAYRQTAGGATYRLYHTKEKINTFRKNLVHMNLLNDYFPHLAESGIRKKNLSSRVVCSWHQSRLTVGMPRMCS